MEKNVFNAITGCINTLHAEGRAPDLTSGDLSCTLRCMREKYSCHTVTDSYVQIDDCATNQRDH